MADIVLTLCPLNLDAGQKEYLVNLTNKYVASIKPPRDKKYICLWDGTIKGFGLRVTDKNVKSYVFAGRHHLSEKPKPRIRRASAKATEI